MQRFVNTSIISFSLGVYTPLNTYQNFSDLLTRTLFKELKYSSGLFNVKEIISVALNIILLCTLFIFLTIFALFSKISFFILFFSIAFPVSSYNLLRLRLF